MATRRSTVPAQNHSDPSAIGQAEPHLELREYHTSDLQQPTAPVVFRAMLSLTQEAPEAEDAPAQTGGGRALQ